MLPRRRSSEPGVGLALGPGQLSEGVGKGLAGSIGMGTCFDGRAGGFRRRGWPNRSPGLPGWARGDGRVAWLEPRMNEGLRPSVSRRTGRAATGRTRGHRREALVRSRLVEVVLRRRLGLDWIDLGRLVEEEVALRWPTGRRDWRGPVGQIEVNEDGADHRRIGKESERSGARRRQGENPHLATTARAQERQHLVDAGEKLGPAESRGSSWSRGDLGAVGLRGFRGRDVVARTRVIAGLAFLQGDHLRPKPGVRRKDAVVSMTMDAWRRDEARRRWATSTGMGTSTRARDVDESHGTPSAEPLSHGSPDVASPTVRSTRRSTLGVSGCFVRCTPGLTPAVLRRRNI